MARPSARSETIAAGIAVRLPNGWATLTAEHEGVFRLSIGAKRRPLPPTTAFLAPDRTERTDGGPAVLQDGLMVGIGDRFGSLWIDPATGGWKLCSPSGDTLVRPMAPARHPRRVARVAAMELHVGWPRDTPILGYGSGNGAIALQQSEGPSQVGNGRAIVPYLWSSHGYAMLAVTADDARPARWRADNEHSAVVWTFPGDTAHLHLMPAASLKEACGRFAALTGRAPVPPRWTFGYLQSRWGWKDRADMERVLREFRRRGFPVDAFILDFEWYTTEPDYELPPGGTRDFPDFAVNPAMFPDLRRQLAEFHAQGLKIIAIRKPRVGDAATLRDLRAKGWMLDFSNDPERKWHVREVDFTRPELRAWYAQRMRSLLEAGIDAWWNDEGESSFVTYHYWNQAEYDLAKTVRPGARFWSLNRAFTPGLQRFGATAWTGDANATWEALAATPTHLLNWGLAGMPYGGCDIGGFRGETTPELFVRWIQAGVFFPMMRAHTSHEWTPRFPWLFGAQAESALRHAFELRYRLIPYFYSLAHQSHATGLPVMRPLAMEFPDDPLLANLSDQWLMGDRLMAAPILQPADQRKVYLPAGAWQRFGTGQTLEGGRVIQVRATIEEIPVFVRAGTLVPLGPVVPGTSAMPGGPLHVQIYPGADASFTLVEDDGTTLGYLDGQSRRITFAWDDARRVLSWRVTGSYDGKDVFRALRAERMGSAAGSSREVPLEGAGELSLVPSGQPLMTADDR